MNDGTINSLDLEKAPALAHRDMFLNAEGRLHDLRSTLGIWRALGLDGCLPSSKIWYAWWN